MNTTLYLRLWVVTIPSSTLYHIDYCCFPTQIHRSVTCLIHHVVIFFSLSWKTLRVCTACVFLWCFMIYACIKWIFCYFFWCFNASLPFFVCPKTASSSLNIKAHHSNAFCSASLTWALNTHHISIPPAEHSLFRFHMPPFLWHTEISFAGAFSTPKKSLLLMTPCVLVTRAAQLHNIDVI